jgi:hypothetical protein
MFGSRYTPDLTALWDVLLGTAAVGWILAFLVAVGAAAGALA